MNSRKLFEFDETQILLQKNTVEELPSPALSDTPHQGRDKNNYISIVGTDEAGRGPGAGDVFSAAVYFPNIDNDLINSLNNLNDSKKLSEKVREELYDIITANSIWSVHQGSVSQIEKSNILAVSLWTMKLSCEEVIKKADLKNPLVLVDGNKLIRQFSYKQKWVKKGDSLSASIAAASIIAKVTRDRYMDELDKEFPEYDWKNNKGYLTKTHLDAVDKYGFTKYHRRKFFEKHLQKEKQVALPF